MLCLNWCPVQGNLRLSKDIAGNLGISSAKTSQFWVEFMWQFSKLLLNGTSNAIITLFCCNTASILTVTSSSTRFCFSCVLCIVRAHWSRKTQLPRYYNNCKPSVPEFHNGGTSHLISASALIIVYYFFIQMWLNNHKIKFQMQGLLCGSKCLSTKSEFTVVLKSSQSKLQPLVQGVLLILVWQAPCLLGGLNISKSSGNWMDFSSKATGPILFFRSCYSATQSFQFHSETLF